MAPMALKLFRTTGHSTLIMPGETRLAPHPVRLVLVASLWLALACNVALWRAVASSDAAMLALALKIAGAIAGGSAIVLGLLGWRRTLKPVATLLLLAGAVIACGIWSQGLPIDSLWTQRPRALLPSWANLLRWQVLVLLAMLAVVPVVWVWSLRLRRLPGPNQLNANLLTAGAGAAVLTASVLLLA
jgi:lipid A ethanolaminephosphotransferase